MIIIIGKGPAGISAALYLLRGGQEARVIGRDGGALARAERIDNYYGFAETISGRQLLEQSWAQLRRLGGEIVTDEVVSIQYAPDGFEVRTPTQTFQAQAVLFATGSARRKPNIPGLSQLEGKGVSYCAVCDGFFYRGKTVALLGSGEYAAAEAQELLPVVATLHVITNGNEISGQFPQGCQIHTQTVEAIEGEDRFQAIRFADGSRLEAEGLFVAQGTAGTGELALKLGVLMEKGCIQTGPDGATNIPGIYAAGDCTGGLLQVAKAVSDGAIAAGSMLAYLRKQKKT